MLYSEFYYTDAGVLGNNPLQYNGASIYDPNFNLGGHQPRGHDQWELIYNRYRVLSCKFECFVKSGAASPMFAPVLCLVRQNPNQSQAPRSGPDAFVDMKEVKKLFNNTYTPGYNQKVVHKIKGVGTTAAALGISRSEARDGHLHSAAFGSSPTRPWYWELYVIHPILGLGPLTDLHFSLTIKLSYKVLMYEPKQIGQS